MQLNYKRKLQVDQAWKYVKTASTEAKTQHEKIV